MRFKISPEGLSAAGLPAAWADVVFEVPQRITFRHMELVERASGKSIDDWSTHMTTRANMWLAIRDHDPKTATWAQMADLAPDDVLSVDPAGDDDENHPDGEADVDLEGETAPDPTLPAGRQNGKSGPAA